MLSSEPRAHFLRLLPLAFVTVALVALVVLPLLGERQVRPMHRYMRDIAEPARSQVTELHLALALQGSAVHEYVETRDAQMVSRFEQAHASELSAYRRLEPFIEQLGPEVQARYEEYHDWADRWHQRVNRIMQPRTPRALSRDPLQEDIYEQMLVAAARLDRSINERGREWRERISAAEAVQLRLSVAVALLALAAIVTVAWLARRLRLFAARAERERQELQRAIESRSRLMRGISHDLKNPLAAIDGHAQVLVNGIKGPLAPLQRESVLRIRAGVSELLNLIGDLVDLWRAEAGQLSVVPQPVDLGSVATDAAEAHRVIAESSGHRLTLDVPEPAEVVTDPDRVRQVLANLLSNAVKHTPAGGDIIVRVRRGRREEQQDWYVVEVADSGPGIPLDQLEHIFGEFTRLSGATPGSGLGLAIARRIAELLGGRLTADSVPGSGATFTLLLPKTAPQAE